RRRRGASGVAARAEGHRLPGAEPQLPAAAAVRGLPGPGDAVHVPLPHAAARGPGDDGAVRRRRAGRRGEGPGAGALRARPARAAAAGPGSAPVRRGAGTLALLTACRGVDDPSPIRPRIVEGLSADPRCPFLDLFQKSRETASVPTTTELQQLLRGAGLRVTRPRVAVLRAAHAHPH